MTVSHDDIRKEISADELSQLSDLNHTGAQDDTVIDDAIADALGYIGSFFPLPDIPTPLLQQIAVETTVYYLRKRNGMLSEQHMEFFSQNETRLNKMMKGQLPVSPDDPDAKSSSAAVFRHGGGRMDLRGYR